MLPPPSLPEPGHSWSRSSPNTRPAELPSPVLVLQEVFLPQLLIDPARSEDGCGEPILADQAQGLQK